MKRYIQVVWDNLFLKTFNFKGRTNSEEYLICIIFWWVIFFLAFPALVIDSSSEFLKTISVVLGAFALYLQLVPFTSLRVRRLHDTGKDGVVLIGLYFLVLVFGIGFILMRSIMYNESMVEENPEETKGKHYKNTVEHPSSMTPNIEDVEL